MIQPIYRMGAEGLDSHEQGLLAQQLKMLNGKTGAQWRYVSEHQDVELLIVRNVTSDPAQATAVLGNVHTGHTTRQQVEWPLRLFGLLDLLIDAETRLIRRGNSRPSRSLAARLAELQTDALLDHDGLQLAVSPGLEQVKSNRADFDALIEELLALPDTVALSGPQPAPASASQRYSMKRLLWALALREPIDSPLPADTLFRIKSWPAFSEWKSTPQYLRLAALYSRQYATVEQGADFADCAAEEVSAFLQACNLCALGLVSKTAPPERTQGMQRTTDPQPASLLQRLRSRLGLGFRKG